MQLVDSSTWQSCVGGMSSKPGETKLSLAGGTGAPTESWTLSVVGQNASSAVITCNANGIVCAFASDRVQGTSTTKYATTNKAFDIKVSTWTQGSFIGTAESVQALRTVAVPGQVDQQVVDGVTIVFVATAKLAPSPARGSEGDPSEPSCPTGYLTASRTRRRCPSSTRSRTPPIRCGSRFRRAGPRTRAARRW